MEKRNKILFISNVDWYFNLHWLDRALAARELFHEVHISFHITNPELTYIFESLGFIVHPIKLERRTINPLKSYITYIQVSKLISEISPDCVHSITVKPNLISGYICKRKKINQIMSVTGLGRAFTDKSLKSVFVKMLTIFLYRNVSKGNSNKIIFENKEDLNLFLNDNVARKERLILINGAGVDTEKYKFYPLPQRRGDLSPFRILFAARMLHDKGLESLIFAVERLKELNIVIDVAGILDNDSDNAISIDTINSWHSENRINWIGSVDDVRPLIYNSDLVCLPTTYGEGVPRILIESASCGRPIITTNISGCKDIVIDNYNGLTVPLNDIEALAEAIDKLLRHEQLRVSFGMNGRKLVENFFSKNIVVEKTKETYNFW